MKFQTYNQCAEGVVELARRYVQEHPDVKLRFKDWGRAAYAGPLSGPSLAYLCASQDAVEMCEWIDEQTGYQATLIMMYAAVELLGLKPKGFTIALTEHQLS